MFLIILFFSAVIAFAITEEEFRKDREYLDKVKERLEAIDREVQEKGVSVKLIDEINSYGYPLHSMKDKYLLEEKEEYKRFYKEVSETYEKMMYVKRGMFPEVLKKEMKEQNLPVCDVRVEGKRREILTVVVENPRDEEAIMKIMTNTQLQYAHLIGIETLNFESCDKGLLNKVENFLLLVYDRVKEFFNK